MEMRRLGQCLDSETLQRIEDVRARLGGIKGAGDGMGGNTSAPAVTSGPKGGGGTDSPFHSPHAKTAKVIRLDMFLRKGTAKPPIGSPADVVVLFRKDIGHGHAK